MPKSLDFSKLTDAELIEYEELIHQRDIADRFKLLREPTEDNSSPNYRALHNAIETQEWGFKIDDSGKKVPALLNGYAGYILEGSSRSTKTWSGIDTIIWLCTQKHKEEGCTINIYRETYNEFKTTLYDDFKRRLDHFELDNKFHRTDEVKNFKIGKSKIHFLGDGKHGGGCDYAFFNEAMMIKQSVFKQVAMRCRRFWWMDYNPSYTTHWVFDSIEPRADVGFLRTTFRDNPFIKPSELNEIVITEPWLPGSYYVEDDCLMFEGEEIDDKNQPPPHPVNAENKTIDEFYWKVYGMGLRGAMKGVIYKKVTWIDEFPNFLAPTYGLDFGFTADPSALIKYAKRGKNVYIELLWYASTETSEDMHKALRACRVSKKTPITADSADKHVSEKKGTVQMVLELFNNYGYNIRKVSKTKGIMYWVLDTKKFKIHIVKNLTTEHGKKMYAAMKKEKENYKMAEVQGILINQPEDGNDHAWNAFRYAHMARRQRL